MDTDDHHGDDEPLSDIVRVSDDGAKVLACRAHQGGTEYFAVGALGFAGFLPVVDNEPAAGKLIDH